MSGGSLTSRLALAMAAIAALSAVLAGVLIAPLLGSAGEQAVREPLARQAELLARLPTASLLSERADRVAGVGGLTLGLLTSDGGATGAAAALSPAQREALLAGEPVSSTGDLAGESVLLEARPSRSGAGVVLAARASDVDAANDRVRRRVLLALLVGLLVSLGVAGLVATRIGRPLAQTAGAARRMAAGERGVPLPSSGPREVVDMSAALGHLDNALAASEQRQRQFLLSVSHELRTPLTSIRGYAEALADGAIPTDEVSEVASTVVAEARRMERYVQDLLALARLEADDFGLESATVDLAGLIRSAVAAWQPRGASARVSVTSVVPDDGSLVINTDPGRVRQVLDALVDNALRVCPSGSSIVLAVSGTPTSVLVEVRDSGPGLTLDDAAVAFEPGVLHQRYAGSRPGGHGLGLAIVHRLVGRLGGTIAVARAPEGGAAFQITLPR